MLVFAISLVVFCPALLNGLLLWDDGMFILQNESIHSLDWAHIESLFMSTEVGAYTPISRLSLAIDYMIWGSEPFGYHLTSVLLHACNAVLVFGIARLILRKTLKDDRWREWGAFIAALLFALHPLRVESVAWAAERRDMLSGFFSLFSVIAYIRHVDTADDTRRKTPWYAVSFIAFVLACFSKTIVVTLPVVFLVLDIYPFRRVNWKERSALRSIVEILLEKAPFLFFSAALGFFTMHVLVAEGRAFGAADFGWSRRIGQSLVANAIYLQNFVWPAHLNPIEKVLEIYEFWKPVVWWWLLFNAALMVALLFLAKRLPSLFVAWICYLVIITPLLGVAQSGYQLTANRYTYLSMISFALLFGGGVAAVLSRLAPGGALFRIVFLISCGIPMLLAVKTVRQIGVWHDQEVFGRHAVSVAPGNPLAWVNLGEAFSESHKLDEAIDAYRHALALCPYTREPWNLNSRYNLASSFLNLGQTNAAIVELQRAVHIAPTYFQGQFMLASLLYNKGEYREASRHYFLNLQEEYETGCLVDLGLCAGKMKRSEMMMKYLGSAAEQNDPHAYMILADVFVANGEPKQATGLLLVGYRNTRSPEIRKQYLNLLHHDSKFSADEKKKGIEALRQISGGT